MRDFLKALPPAHQLAYATAHLDQLGEMLAWSWGALTHEERQHNQAAHAALEDALWHIRELMKTAK